MENEKFVSKLTNMGYSSCEVCFNVKLKRNRLMKWLEDKKIIKTKIQGFALIIRDFDDIIVLSSVQPHDEFTKIITTKVNGVRN